MLYRVKVKRETRKFFIGISYNKKWYKISKNEHSKKLEVGIDCYIYAKKEKRLLSTILIPISDEEAGVKNIGI